MNKNRPKQIMCRLSEEEFAQVKKEVEKSGMKQQEYLLSVILDKGNINTVVESST